VKVRVTTRKDLSKGAALAVLCGLVLWWTRLGIPLENLSYDGLFRFSETVVTNKPVLILMDNAARSEYGVQPKDPWKRESHTELLNRLADAGCRLVVLDILFDKDGDPATDWDLAVTMCRMGNVILARDIVKTQHPRVTGIVEPQRICTLFESAAAGLGVAKCDADNGEVARRHWPFGQKHGPFPSLAWTAARMAGANLRDNEEERWLRYYGNENNTWDALSYHEALSAGAEYFSNRIVFVGSDPATPSLDREDDEFARPYGLPGHSSMGGVKIMTTSFLNLMQGDWLRRPASWLEIMVLVLSGGVLGAGLCLLRLPVASAAAVLVVLLVMLGAATLSHYSNYWFPSLLIAGAQVPCAWLWSARCSLRPQPASIRALASLPASPEKEEQKSTAILRPDAPAYEYLTETPFGEGAFGSVWLVRNRIGQIQALKAIYEVRFGTNPWPYEAEFNALTKYKPIAAEHPGLLHIDFIDKPPNAGCFYYVMELGDSLVPDWEKNPASYKPRTLASLRASAPGQRLPLRLCLDILIPLTEALDFLHRQGLTHRDIKPQNIVFVRDRPKLADVGLVTHIRSANPGDSRPGTPDYMPPAPEPVGTIAADLYGLGMVLYVISTGHKPEFFPELKTSLFEQTGGPEFKLLNRIILKACDPDPARRPATADELHRALLEVRRA
jgi:CHASE2 domain-containing sensor protein